MKHDYTTLDVEIVGRLGRVFATSFEAIDRGAVVLAYMPLAKAEGKGYAEEFRILERRLQALRKAGKIQHISTKFRGRGWVLVGP